MIKNSKLKKLNLEYNVLVADFNTKRVEEYNVLKVLNYDDIRNKLKRGKIITKDDFKHYLKLEFSYRYMSKCEYEILVSDLFASDTQCEKIDAFKQIDMNFDIIVDYLIKHLELESDLKM